MESPNVADVALNDAGHPAPPPHILASFQLPGAHPVALGPEWSGGWRCDRAVISPAGGQDRAAWTAQVLAKVRPASVTVTRPILSADGRYSVSGWRARTFLSGHLAPRFDEMAAAALRFNEALRGIPRPAFLRPPQVGVEWREVDVFAAADAAAWDEDPTRWVGAVWEPTAVPREDVAAALVKAAHLASLRLPVTEPDQLVHGDPAGCLIFDGVADPSVTDLVPAWHPAGWSVALLIVDAMAWANGPDALLDRWGHLGDMPQLLCRAVLYRLMLHAMHPAARPEAWPGLSRVAAVVAARLERDAEREREHAQEEAARLAAQEGAAARVDTSAAAGVSTDADAATGQGARAQSTGTGPGVGAEIDGAGEAANADDPR